MGPLSPGSVGAEPNGAITSLTFDAGFYAESSADTPDLLEVALDKTDYKSGDAMNVAVTARHRRPPHPQCVHRPPGRQPIAGRQSRHRADQNDRRQGLGHRRLSGRHLAPPARCAGAAHAGPRHRRAVVLDRPHGAHAGARHETAGDAAAQFRAQRAGASRGPCRRRGGAHRGGRRRCRHSQSHQLQAAGARRLLSRPAPAHRRSARSLRPIDRRHAGRARADPLRRRYRRRGIVRLAADAGAAGALFRHRHRRRRRHRAGDVSTFRPLPAPCA